MKVRKIFAIFAAILVMVACKPPDQKKVLTVLDAATISVEAAQGVVASLCQDGALPANRCPQILAALVHTSSSLKVVRAAVVAGKLTPEAVESLAATASADLDLVASMDSNPKLLIAVAAAKAGILAAEVILQSYLGGN
jgi:hypothetical protein